jgi:hypothetical protein
MNSELKSIGDKKKTYAYLLVSIFENATLINRDVSQYFKSQLVVADIWPIISKISEINNLGVSLGRIVIHIVSQVILNGEKTGIFWNFLFDPQKLHRTYIPTMHEDSRQALKDAIGGTGQFYECPNGHSYFVDNCGKPMEIRNCATCGAQIGGKNHNLLSTNTLSNLTDQTPTDYVLREIGDDHRADMFQTVRELTPKALRTIRIFMHALLYVGSIAFQNHAAASRTLIDSRYANPSSVQEFFRSHLNHDWNLMQLLLEKNAEETSIVVHHIIQDACRQQYNALCSTKDQRLNLEKIFCQSGIGGIHSECFENDRMNRVRTEFYNSLQHQLQSTTSTLVAKILETDTRTVSSELPSLWMLTESITFNNFILRCLQNNDLPFMQRFATRHVELKALKYLNSIMKLLNMVVLRYNRRIARDYCKKRTIREEIEEMPRREQAIFEKCFEEFCAAWNCCWSKVEQYKCMPIPKLMKDLVMDDSKALVFLIPNERDEGVFILALLQYLIDLHNEFVDATQEIIGGHVEEVSSRFLTQGQEIITDEDELLPFLKDHCNRPLTHPSLQAGDNNNNQRTKSTGIEYDLSFVQQFLLDHIFTGKPRLILEVRTVHFLGEIRETGARQRLVNQIHQEELRQEMKYIVRNLSIENCRKLLRLVEMAINFLQATTAQKQHVADRSLLDYLDRDLEVSDTHLFATIRDIKLKHLDSLWRTLESHLTSDIFSDVQPAYKQPLNDLKPILESVLEFMDCKLLADRLKEYLLRHLIGGATSESISLKDCLGYFTTSDENEDIVFSDINWFEQYFPDSILMRHCLETYKVLEAYATQKKVL